MLFPEASASELPTIILLHGGGLSDWSWQPVADALAGDFQVVAPVIDGHGRNGQQDFASIQESATQVIAQIDARHGGKVFALGGLSLGAQIVVEVLARRPDIALYAIVESALVVPIRSVTWMAAPTYTLLHGLIKLRWFSRMQAKALNIPADMWEAYYRDSLKISLRSLINIAVSNSTYSIPEGIGETSAKILIIVGEKEIGIMRDSARLLHEKVAQSEVYIAPSMKHGELSLAHPAEYVALLRSFFAHNADGHQCER